MTPFRFLLLTVVILGVAFGLRGAVALWWQERLNAQGQRFAMGDSESYWFLARQIAAKEPYYYNTPNASVFRVPGYPWLLSFVVDVDDPNSGMLAARLLGSAFGVLAIGLSMSLAAILYDRTTAIICGMLGTLYPGAITTSVLVLSEAPFLPLMVVVLIALCMVQRKPEQAYGWTVVAGVVSGLSTLVRPSWLLFLPCYYLYRFCFFDRRIREFQLAALAGVSVAVAMTPWWIRNYQVTGHFVITTLQTGATLYDGFHPGATGGSDSGMTFSGDFANRLMAEVQEPENKNDNFEYRLNQSLTVAAVDWVVSNPVQAILLGFKKFYRTWWPLPSVSEIPGGLPTRLVFAVGMLGILIPGLVKGLRALLDSRSQMFPIIMPVLYFAVLHTVFVGSIRYRQPAIFALTILAAPQLCDWAKSVCCCARKGSSLSREAGK